MPKYLKKIPQLLEIKILKMLFIVLLHQLEWNLMMKIYRIEVSKKIIEIMHQL